jgi:hypothetical protein
LLKDVRCRAKDVPLLCLLVLAESPENTSEVDGRLDAVDLDLELIVEGAAKTVAQHSFGLDIVCLCPGERYTELKVENAWVQRDVSAIAEQSREETG